MPSDAPPELRFVVIGSRGDRYQVVFSRSAERVHMSCTCQAGQMGQPCKHRIELLGGDATGLEEGSSEDVKRLRQTVAGTPLADALAAWQAARNAEKAAKAATNQARRMVGELLAGQAPR